MNLPPPGWYADPTTRFKQRFWDGHIWTDQVMYGAGQLATDPVIPPPGAIGSYAPNTTLVQAMPIGRGSSFGMMLTALAVLLPMLFLAVMGMQASHSVADLAESIRQTSCERLLAVSTNVPSCPGATLADG